MIHIVIGKNFGDEGKGLCTDYFSMLAQKNNKRCLVIRHNGGAQAGHTVDLYNKRFVFHQLSSGSFRQADTLWADAFLPDLYKLPEEVQAFRDLAGYTPPIYASGRCRCVYIDDVLLNMAIETQRGPERHGSCGMGINESVDRSMHKEFLITLEDIKSMTAEEICRKMKIIRNEYLPLRLKELGLMLDKAGVFGELLSDNKVIRNASEKMCVAAEHINLDYIDILSSYDEVIFEGAQGLLLDEDNISYSPHITSSHTGIHNPADFYQKHFQGADCEIIYVSRAYVTRHGAGPLPYENMLNSNFSPKDPTNTPNEWQGSMRSAPHGTVDEFLEPVINDLSECQIKSKVSLMVTHLNETNGNIFRLNNSIPIEKLCKESEISELFEKFYFSYSPYAEEIKEQEYEW